MKSREIWREMAQVRFDPVSVVLVWLKRLLRSSEVIHLCTSPIPIHALSLVVDVDLV